MGPVAQARCVALTYHGNARILPDSKYFDGLLETGRLTLAVKICDFCLVTIHIFNCKFVVLAWNAISVVNVDNMADWGKPRNGKHSPYSRGDCPHTCIKMLMFC